MDDTGRLPPLLPPLLPLFPLQTVLFPGALLPLHVFEARYMDLVARCLKDGSVFGVNLIAEGHEVGAPARPCEVGVSARIVRCDIAKPGTLDIVTRGEHRYRVLRTELGANGLLLGEVDWLAEAPRQAIPDNCQPLVALLRAIVADAGDARLPAPHAFDDAGWVGLRFAEVLPIPAQAKQALLELDDPADRLEIIRQFLDQRGLLGERMAKSGKGR
ncbi:LON peptidase substrate-binding domain-containing protein [Aromatoleum toluclasticum]|uniref:LON peptidase substrate-binding domain-containing protein n=1 Tax=Aromatoleum toluclasticum TaxID=92003 RepID=UPI001D18BA69|nr:LON peptidase substrate-binding domain-containing protein [Aromatoleum toluclasticum]MCC4113853.1 LON peptidase substrate-binding domain-containing protein [Aromatoleum toluclasticum]